MFFPRSCVVSLCRMYFEHKPILLVPNVTPSYQPISHIPTVFVHNKYSHSQNLSDLRLPSFLNEETKKCKVLLVARPSVTPNQIFQHLSLNNLEVTRKRGSASDRGRVLLLLVTPTPHEHVTFLCEVPTKTSQWGGKPPHSCSPKVSISVSIQAWCLWKGKPLFVSYTYMR